MIRETLALLCPHIYRSGFDQIDIVVDRDKRDEGKFGGND